MTRTDDVHPSAFLREALRGGDRELGFDLGPLRLDGGRSAELHRFRLSAGPADLVDRDLVLRVLHPRTGYRGDEAVIQHHVAALGYPAPQVLRRTGIELDA